MASKKTIEAVKVEEDSGFNLLNVAVIGSSFNRRMELVNSVWGKIKDIAGDTPVLGAVVDAPPQISQSPSIDLDMRERVLIWQELQSKEEMFSRMTANNIDVGFNFCPYTAYSFLVERIILNNQMSMELEKHKPILIEGQAPRYATPILNNMFVENNNVTAGIPSLQNVMTKMYEGFWAYRFMLGSDEPTAPSMTIHGKDFPTGTEEQVRHFYFSMMVESMKLPFINLSDDIEEASRVMALSLCVGAGIKVDE